MNSNVKKLWIEAALSDLYRGRQTTGRMRNPDDGKYCFLGVLQAIAIQCGVVTSYEVDWTNSSLHQKVIDWAELIDVEMIALQLLNDGLSSYEAQQREMWRLYEKLVGGRDREGPLSFTDLADVIRLM